MSYKGLMMAENETCTECEKIIKSYEDEGHGGSPMESYVEGYHLCAKGKAPKVDATHNWTEDDAYIALMEIVRQARNGSPYKHLLPGLKIAAAKYGKVRQLVNQLRENLEEPDSERCEVHHGPITQG